MSHDAEPPRSEFKISLGKCRKDLAAMMVALRRLGFFILISVVQIGLTQHTSNGKVLERRHAVLVRPQDVGSATLSCGMEEHRLTATAAQMPALNKLLFIDLQEQIDRALEEIPALRLGATVFSSKSGSKMTMSS